MAWGAPAGAGGDLAGGCWCPRWRGWSFHSGSPFPATHQDTLENTGAMGSAVHPLPHTLSLGSLGHLPAWMRPRYEASRPCLGVCSRDEDGVCSWWAKVKSICKTAAGRANGSPAAGLYRQHLCGLQHTQPLASPGFCSWDTSTLAGSGCHSGERISVEISPPSPNALQGAQAAPTCSGHRGHGDATVGRRDGTEVPELGLIFPVLARSFFYTSLCA